MNQDRLKRAVSLVTKKTPMCEFPEAWRILVWEMMKIQTAVKIIKGKMDKQINKVKRDVEKGDKKKAKKDIKKLLKMDKKFDAKLEKCGKMKGKK